jgi:hypothetical protein
MTITQMQTRVSQWLDTVGSGRFDPDDIDAALNTAIGNKVDDLFHPMDPKQLENSFQTHQRIKDSLYPLIKKSGTIVAVAGIIPTTSLTDYRYCIDLFATITQVEYITTPLRYTEYENFLTLDPFAKPTLVYPSRVFRLDVSNGFEIKFGPVGTLQTGRFIYLRNPATVSYTGGTKVNCDLPVLLHEDICKMAAEILAMQVQHLTERKQ